jgi:hypothetical protein
MTICCVLKEGTQDGKKHSVEDDALRIKSSLQATLQQVPQVIQPQTQSNSCWAEWFVQHKCSTEAMAPYKAQGRRDPSTGDTLFTAETKVLLKLQAQVRTSQDPLPLDKMYAAVLPNPNSNPWIDRIHVAPWRINLSPFILMLAHLQTGMGGVANPDNKSTGTLRGNLAIRHRLRLTLTTAV